MARPGRVAVQSLLVLALLRPCWLQFISPYVAPSVFTQQPVAGSPELQDNTKVLLCQVSGVPPPVYRWKKDGTFITASNVTETAHKIKQIQRSDAGVYQCVASNDYGAVLSNRVHVHVAYLIPLRPVSATEPVNVQQGQAAVISLPSIDSYPVPTVQWFEGQTAIPTETQRYHVTLDFNLVILETRPEDTGKRFKATAQNSYTGEQTDSQVFIMNVQGVPNLVMGPQIVVPPTPTTAVQGSDVSVELECVANARSLNYLQLNWYRIQSNGQKLSIKPDAIKYFLSMYRRKLTIKMPVLADSGVYECEAVYNRGGDPSFPAVRASTNLTVYVSPNFATPPPSQINKDDGSTVEISCQSVGVPAPVVQWYRNAVKIDDIIKKDARYTILDMGNLQISELTPKDSGVFQCFVSNPAGETNGATWLRVLSFPPRIVQPLGNHSVIAGDTARFQCDVEAAPKPTVTWSRVTSRGTEDLCCSTSTVKVLDGELLLTQTNSADTGQYICNATNSKGSTTSASHLSVVIKTKIVVPPQNVSAVKGSTTTMTCTVQKDPDVTVTWSWYKDNEYLASGGRRTLNPDGGLEIVSVRSEDIGWYECKVTSSAGNDSAAGSLKVVELPQPPTILSVGKNANSDRAVDVNWNPGFDGNVPILRFTLQYRLDFGIPLMTNEAWISANNSIPPEYRSYTVANLFPARTYEFRMSAFNSVGQGDWSPPSNKITLPQQPPSGPPLNVAASPRSNSSIIMQWSPPEEDKWNGILLGYMIKYQPSGYGPETQQLKNISDVSQRSTILEDLIIFQEYLVSVAGYNAKGVGVYSDPTRARTLEGRPEAPPTEFTAEALSSTSIRLTWMPPKFQRLNGINQGYKIEIENLNSSEILPIIEVPSNTSNMLGRQTKDLTGLEKFTAYRMTVLCFTNVGNGPKSERVEEQTDEDVPDKVASLTFPPAFILDTSLMAKWTPPEKINGILLGYILTYMRKGVPSSQKEENLGPETLSHTITGLTATTVYTISVRARSRKGPGEARSADIQSGVPPEKPGPPKNLAVTKVDAFWVTIRFIPGFNGHTSISQWIVEAQVGNSLDWTQVFSKVDPDATSLNVTGLIPYTNYVFRMIAENVADRSDPSEPTQQIQTVQAPPSNPPDGVNVYAVNETALRVLWMPLPSNKWNGLERGYRVEYQVAGDDDSSKTIPILDENANSYTIAGLQEFTKYNVRVAAFNKAGTGPYSAVMEGVTRQSTPSAGPASVNATAVSSTSILVWWEEVPQADQNGIILGYKVNYRVVDSGLAFSSKTVENSTKLETTIIGLLKYVWYEIEVLAYTQVGDGVPHKPRIRVRTHEDLPGPPIGIYFPEVTSTSVRVYWSPPIEPNGVIIGYRVTYKRNLPGAEPIEKVDNLGPQTRNFYAPGLESEKEYIFGITARTGLGWGTEAAVKVGTFENRIVPLTPSKPVKGQVGKRYAVISWTAGAISNAPIRNFTIQKQRNTGDFEDVLDYVPYDVLFHNVTGLTPHSRYRFRVAANNDVGQSPFSTPSDELTTLDDAPSQAPTDLKITAETSNSVRANWTPLSDEMWNGKYTGYRLDSREADSSQTWIPHNIEDPGARTTVISEFVLYKTYEFRINAYNDEGSSPWSPTVVFFMEIVPSAAPVSFTVQAISSTEIDASWNPPPLESLNGDLLGYKLFYRVSSDPLGSSEKIILGAGHQSTLIQDLRKWTYYNFTILAYNSAGDGPNVSKPVYARTHEDKPGEPGELSLIMVSLTSMNISWSPPEEPNGIIIEYEVSYQQANFIDGESRSVQVKITDPQKTYHIAEGLTENVMYVFNVKARTKEGWGPQRQGNVTTGPQPGSPAKPGVPQYSTTDTSITLRWTNGHQGDSPIRGYVIQGQESGNPTWQKISASNVPTPSAVIPFKNLKPGTEYRFRIVAINGQGISYPSDPSALVRTPDNNQKPFYQQWWFLVIVALTGVILIIVVMSLLCLTGRRLRKKVPKEPTYATNQLGVPLGAQVIARHNPPPQPKPEPVVEDDGGFTNFEMRRSERKSQRSMGKRNGLPPPYVRSPPRPSPGSVNYSDDDTKTYADDSSTLSDKPSQCSSSPEPSDSEPEFEKNPYGTFGRPPQYSNPPVQQSWGAYQRQPSNAYSYTDSEVESSHYAPSLNGGHIIMNNRAGSRAPLPGFSSFV